MNMVGVVSENNLDSEVILIAVRGLAEVVTQSRSYDRSECTRGPDSLFKNEMTLISHRNKNLRFESATANHKGCLRCRMHSVIGNDTKRVYK